MVLQCRIFLGVYTDTADMHGTCWAGRELYVSAITSLWYDVMALTVRRRGRRRKTRCNRFCSRLRLRLSVLSVSLLLWLIYWLLAWLIDWLIDWLIGWLVGCWPVDWKIQLLRNHDCSIQNISTDWLSRARAHTHTHKPACTGLQQQWRFNKKATQTLQG